MSDDHSDWAPVAARLFMANDPRSSDFILGRLALDPDEAVRDAVRRNAAWRTSEGGLRAAAFREAALRDPAARDAMAAPVLHRAVTMPSPPDGPRVEWPNDGRAQAVAIVRLLAMVTVGGVIGWALRGLLP